MHTLVLTVIVIITLLSFVTDAFLQRIWLMEVPWLDRFKWMLFALLIVGAFWSAVVYFGRHLIECLR